jgi:hypothetical protein
LNFSRLFINNSSKPFESLPNPVDRANYASSYGNCRSAGLGYETAQSQCHGAALNCSMVIFSELPKKEQFIGSCGLRCPLSTIDAHRAYCLTISDRYRRCGGLGTRQRVLH